jgi:hypothetical protein
VLSFFGIFVELLCFPDLTQGEAAINEKNPQVEGNDATLDVKAEINGEMYVLYYILSQMIMFIITGFEADLINLLQSFVFGKPPTN